MKYFTYKVPTLLVDGVTVDGEHKTISSDEIRRDYYPGWRERAVSRYGEQYVNDHFIFEDCLVDWCIEHDAWESWNDDH